LHLHSADITAKYVSAYLNTDGGVLYYGITDAGIISGVEMNRKARDIFVRNVDAVLNRFAPHLGADLVTIKFVDVQRDAKAKLPDL
jgi:predicted HTH transcriptional regulator